MRLGLRLLGLVLIVTKQRVLAGFENGLADKEDLCREG